MLLIIFIDETAFILYNISLYQMLCAAALGNPIFSTYFPNYYFLDNNEHFLNYEHINSFYNQFENILLKSKIDLYTEELISNSISKDNIFDINNITNSINYNDNSIFLVFFDSFINKQNLVDFYILQKKLYVLLGETTLAFFRIENLTYNNLSIYSLYNVYPSEYTIFLNKVQCFCFEQLLLNPKELVDLPILFYIDPLVKTSSLYINWHELYITYFLMVSIV